MGCGASAMPTPAIEEDGWEAAGEADEGEWPKPLTIPPSWTSEEPMTRHSLDQKREEFWHTRVEGIREVWNAIRAACEAMCQEDVDLATAVLLASEVTTPSGTLAICYGPRGNRYKVPRFCWSTPRNLLTGRPGEKEVDLPSSKAAEDESADGGEISVRMRFPSSPVKAAVTICTTDSIAAFKVALAEEMSKPEYEALCKHREGFPPKRQRLIFRGRELDDALTVSGAGMHNDCVAHVVVRPVLD